MFFVVTHVNISFEEWTAREDTPVKISRVIFTPDLKYSLHSFKNVVEKQSNMYDS